MLRTKLDPKLDILFGENLRTGVGGWEVGFRPTTLINHEARLPSARTDRLQQLHSLLWLLCVFSSLGNLLFAQGEPQWHGKIEFWHTLGTEEHLPEKQLRSRYCET